MDRIEARQVAYDWHSGQDSPLYSFASTGEVWSQEHRENLSHEINTCITEAQRLNTEEYSQEGPRLRELLAFVLKARIKR